MPRRSPEHLDARRRQILDAARRCFARNGFHATSMQDVFAEAGLSAGAVYRYFPGKEQIVLAIAEEALEELTAAVVADLQADALRPLDEVVGDMLERIQRLDERSTLAAVAVQIWAEAIRSPELAQILAGALGDARAVIGRLVERYREEGLLDGDGSTDEAARVITGLVAGFIVQRAVLRGTDVAVYRAGLAELVPVSGSRRASRRP